jgi:hypothetical protein
MTNRETWNTAIFDPIPESDWDGIDRRLGLPSDEQIMRLAERINESHAGQRNETGPWPVDFRQVGLFCERAFARVFRTPMDTAIRRYGSGRVNATLNDGTRVDVVGRRLRRDRQLPDLTRRVRGHRQSADVCCLILWVGRAWEPVFLGWLPDGEIKERGEKRTFQTGNTDYVVPVARLNTMADLMRRHRPDDPLAQEYVPEKTERPVAPILQPGLF